MVGTVYVDRSCFVAEFRSNRAKYGRIDRPCIGHRDPWLLLKIIALEIGKGWVIFKARAQANIEPILDYWRILAFSTLRITRIATIFLPRESSSIDEAGLREAAGPPCMPIGEGVEVGRDRTSLIKM